MGIIQEIWIESNFLGNIYELKLLYICLIDFENIDIKKIIIMFNVRMEIKGKWLFNFVLLFSMILLL